MKNLLAFAAVLLFSLSFAARVFAGQVRYDDSPVPGASARPVSEELLKSTVYQIFLRPFTQEGTLKSAERLLPHVASLGVKIIQLCPVVLADDDPDKNFWSGRQRAFGLNPKNPYRQKDYFKIDPEYGSAPCFTSSSHSGALFSRKSLVSAGFSDIFKVPWSPMKDSK